MSDELHRRKKIPDHATRVFQGVLYDVYHWDQQLFNGETATFEGLRHADAVSIIPIIDDQLVVLHEEQPNRPPYYSFPGGGIEPGETPQAAAARELLEETGMSFAHLKLVAIEDIGGSDKIEFWAYRFIATDLVSTTQARPEAGERIVIQRRSFAEAKLLSEDSVYMSQVVMRQVNALADLHELPDLS